MKYPIALLMMIAFLFPGFSWGDIFYQALVGMSSSEVSAYWARLMFQEHTSPPVAVPGRAVVRLISANPNMIGYILEGEASAKVKSVFVIHPND